jgi:hypothetical protein
MKKYLTLLPLALGGCTFNGGVATTVGTIATIVSHSQQACSDIAALGADSVSIAKQVAAANPNDAKIQSIANAVISGAGATNADCQSLAAAVTAEAPKSLLHRKILVDPKVFSHL